MIRDTLQPIRERSMLAWDMAIQTADNPADSDRATLCANECAKAYARAMETTDHRTCREDLLEAQRLEREWGDDQHARAALAALDGR